MRKPFTLAAAALAALVAPALAPAQQHGHGTGPQVPQGTTHAAAEHDMTAAMSPQPGDGPFVRAFKESQLAMMRGMHGPITGDPDRDFAAGMIPHHQGAIDMARIQLEHGKDPELRELARKIIADQEREIAQLRGWQGRNP